MSPLFEVPLLTGYELTPGPDWPSKPEVRFTQIHRPSSTVKLGTTWLLYGKGGASIHRRWIESIPTQIYGRPSKQITSSTQQCCRASRSTALGTLLPRRQAAQECTLTVSHSRPCACVGAFARKRYAWIRSAQQFFRFS